jgi:uncharacterized spore protein YtfJ
MSLNEHTDKERNESVIQTITRASQGLSLAAPVKAALDGLQVRSVFGQPVHRDNTTVIPVTKIIVFALYGGGVGGHNTSDELPIEQENPSAKERTRGGGGGGGAVTGWSLPQGYIEISQEGARFKAITSWTDLLLLGIILLFFSFLRSISRRHYRERDV